MVLIIKGGGALQVEYLIEFDTFKYHKFLNWTDLLEN